MLYYRIPTLILPWILLAAGTALGQVRSQSLRPTDYRRAGLEQAWTAQVAIDRTRSLASNLQLQVVGTDSYDDYLTTSYPVYEVQYDKGVRRFSAIDLGRDGNAIGDAEAARLAEKEKIRMEARGYTVKLETQRVPRCVLYVQSNSGLLQAIDAENGRTLWALLVGRPDYPTLTPAANDKYVSVINGSSLYLLERLTGEQIWKRSLQNNPTIGPVLTREMVFAPATNGQIEGHWLPGLSGPRPKPGELELRKPTWYYRSDSLVTAAITATANTISWPTQGGRMYVADLTDPEVKYMVRTGAPIYGHSVFVEPDRLAIASMDGYIYCLNEADGYLQWEYSAGEPIRESLFGDGEQIYAITELGNLHSVSADGIRQWLAPGIDRILSVSSQRLYVMGSRGVIYALDPKTGGRLMSLNTTGFDLTVVNSLTDRIYLASSDGTISCLRELQAELPTIHVSMPTPPAQDEDVTSRPATKAAPGTRGEFSPPADDATFDEPRDADAPNREPMDDEPMDADPFAPLGEGDDPFAPVDGDAEDPFGF